MTPRLLTLTLTLGLTLGLTACQADAPDADAAEFTEVPQGPAELAVTRPFTPAAPDGGTGGVFLTIAGGPEADTLVAARYDGAARVEVHETYEAEGGMRGMREVEAGIPVPAGGDVELAPGGYHIMLIALDGATTEGDTLDLTLDFARAGAVPVRVAVVSLDQIPGRAPSSDSPQPDAE